MSRGNMNQKEYILKMKIIQKQYLLNLKELSEYFGMATVTILKFRQGEEVQWATLKKIKDKIDKWEESHGIE